MEEKLQTIQNKERQIWINYFTIKYERSNNQKYGQIIVRCTLKDKSMTCVILISY